VRTLAVLSLHTSPLAQPGTGDSGGMNVYVRELVGSLAQAGIDSTVYVRRWRNDLPEVVDVEPGFRVVHVAAGPVDLPKEQLPEVVDEYTAAVRAHLRANGGAQAIHANYWLSGVAGHALKHDLDLPLVSTFHTLARVKAVTGDAEPQRRVDAEMAVIGCSDAILASCTAEAEQIIELYDAPAERIEIVPPGVDHAFFSPGDRRGARDALGLGEQPVLLFVGRIQPLKGLAVAIESLALLRDDSATLVVVGGPSGTDGADELVRAHRLVDELGLHGRVRFVEPQPHHLLSTYYRAADIAIVPSRSESFGLVALEAAACGTPVVAAAVGGLTTIVEDGHTGLLVEDRAARRFAEACDAILADPRGARDMSRAASERARGYTWSVTAARLRRLYADLATRSPVQCALTLCACTSASRQDARMADEIASPELRRDVEALIDRWLADQLEQNPAVAAIEKLVGPLSEPRWFVRLLGEQKDVFTIWYTLRQRTLHYETYVMPAPEENEAQFYEHVLRRNLKFNGAAFAIGEEDALFLVGQLPLHALDEGELDRVLGSLYSYVEQCFRPAMRIGFASRFRG
jgi:D-inositol-3-phosphate glycosyltransferase